MGKNLGLRNVATWLTLAVVAAGLAGCNSGGEFSTATVSGKVTAQGKPVEGGSISFLPAGGGMGKPAAGEIQKDGTYTLTTYKPSDGAIPGKYTINFSAPQIVPEDLKPGESLPESPWHGMTPKESQVEVKEGANTIDIELAPGPAGS